MKTSISTSLAPPAIGPYSQGIIVDGMVYVSGQLPLNPSTGAMASGIKEQTRQSLENIRAILAESGCTMDNVVRCGIFLKNMEDFAAVNEIYGSYFTPPFPVRSTVEVSRLPKDAAVEIEAFAQIPR